jgi:hypothetical protein
MFPSQQAAEAQRIFANVLKQQQQKRRRQSKPTHSFLSIQSMLNESSSTDTSSERADPCGESQQLSPDAVNSVRFRRAHTLSLIVQTALVNAVQVPEHAARLLFMCITWPRTLPHFVCSPLPTQVRCSIV